MASVNRDRQANPAPPIARGRQDMAQALAYFFLPAAGFAAGAAFLAATLVFVFWTAFLFVDLGDLSPIVLVFLIFFTDRRNISFPGDSGNMHLFAGRCLLWDANIFQPGGFWIHGKCTGRAKKVRPAAVGAAGRRA